MKSLTPKANVLWTWSISRMKNYLTILPRYSLIYLAIHRRQEVAPPGHGWCASLVFQKKFWARSKQLLKRKVGWFETAVLLVLFSLCEALKFRNYDGPTKTILSYMKKHNFMPPSDWKLYRPLTSKWYVYFLFKEIDIELYLSQSFFNLAHPLPCLTLDFQEHLQHLFLPILTFSIFLYYL